MIEKSCENCRFRDGFCSTCRDCRFNVIENKCFPSEWRPRTEAQLCEDYCNNDVNACKKLIGDISTGYSFADPATALQIEKGNYINELINGVINARVMVKRREENMKKHDDRFDSIVTRYLGCNADFLEPPTIIMSREQYDKMFGRKTSPRQKAMNRIENVIFNDPATIVFWDDGTKTVVKAQNEPFDPEKGLAMAITKYFFDNKGYYCDVFKKWLPKEELDPEAEAIDENKKPDTEFIFLKDFCERNNITKNKAYGMIKRGEIYAFKNINGKWVVEIPVNSNTVSLTEDFDVRR